VMVYQRSETPQSGHVYGAVYTKGSRSALLGFVRVPWLNSETWPSFPPPDRAMLHTETETPASVATETGPNLV
jgi:hypothetical protein